MYTLKEIANLFFLSTQEGYECRLCKLRVKCYQQNLSNLKKHMQRKHQNYLSEEKILEQPQTPVKIRKEDINSTTINSFLQLFSKTSLPFHLLENPPFRTFLKNTANLSYIPSGYELKKAMTVRSESYKHSLIENCSKIKHLSLSLDFWKYNDYNLVCVLIRFWKDEVQTNKIISIESLVDTRSQTLFDHIKTVLIAFKIDYNKILTICTDNCNAMLSFGSLFETQKRSEIVFDLLEEEKQEECDEVMK